MKKGGVRQGAGRKSSWSSSETRPIRVPEYLAAEVLAFAKKLDKERSFALNQERLADLLKEFLHLSQENNQEWIEKPSDIYKEAIGNADVHLGSFQARTIIRGPHLQDVDMLSVISGVEWTIKDLEACRVLELSNGKQIKLEIREGRLECPAMGVPQESVTLFVDDDDGKVYLRICSDWSIDHLLPAKTITIEQIKRLLESSSKDSKKSNSAEKKSEAAKTV